jgi:hypothetical protein
VPAWIVESRSDVHAPWEFFGRRGSRWLADVLAAWVRAGGFVARVRKEDRQALNWLSDLSEE